MAERGGSMLLLACAVLCSTGTCAQEYSYDGNRWYEVETLVFAAAHPPAPYAETTVPEKVRPAYLPRLLQLKPRSSSFQVEFPSERPGDPLPESQPVLLPLQVLQQRLRNGPLYSPALRESFRVLDPAYDPYMELELRGGELLAASRNLDNDGRYRVLWHRQWRQPMQGRAQVQSVFVAGGASYGAHRELEGSLRLSDDGGRVLLELDLWLNRFVPGAALPGNPWQIPEPPFAAVAEVEVDAAVAGLAQAAQWSLAEVWQQLHSQQVTTGQLYYIDHPTLGVLVSIRPYLLPLRLGGEEQADF